MESNSKPLIISELKPALTPVLVTDEEGLRQVDDFFQRVRVFGFDTETNVVSTFAKRKVRTIQVGDRNEQYVIDLLPFAGSLHSMQQQGGRKRPKWAAPIVETLRTALGSREHLKVGANLQFDYEVMLWCLGLRTRGFYDVQLAEKVIYAGRVNFFETGFWALDDLVARYCGLQISKEEQKTFDLENPLTQAQIQYAALDTRLPLAVMGGQAGVIAQAKLQRVVQVENDAIPAFGEMHLNGMLLDRERWMAIVEETKVKHAENLRELDKHFLPIAGVKVDGDKWTQEAVNRLEEVWRSTIDKEERARARKNYQHANREMKDWQARAPRMEGEAAINYGATGQLLAALHTMGFNARVLPNTNDKTLAKFSDRSVIKAIQNYRESSKILTTYGETFLKYIDAETGRVHSRMNQMGAETGRTSSSAPNMQNIPREKRYRSCFIARPGYQILTTDMSGAELRIMADDSGDEMWITAFENDWDLHSMGAEMAEPEKWAAGTEDGCAFAESKQKCSCQVHKKLRDDNKSTNFGVAYGMEEAALAAKLGISKDEAVAKLDKWRKVNAGVQKYLVASGESAKQQFCAHDMIGRRRLFEKPNHKRLEEIAAEREAEDAKKAKRDPRPVDAYMMKRVYFMVFASIEREGKNMRVQGTNASIAKIAMGAGFDKDGKPFMWDLLPQYGALLESFVHDEFVVEVPVARAEACRAMVEDCILRAGAEVLHRVKMLSESHIADCWTK